MLAGRLNLKLGIEEQTLKICWFVVKLCFNDGNLGELQDSIVSTHFFKDCVLRRLLSCSILDGFDMFDSDPLLLSITCAARAVTT